MNDLNIPANKQVHMGNFHVTLRDDGSLHVHVWPANGLVVSRPKPSKDFRQLIIKRVYPQPRYFSGKETT